MPYPKLGSLYTSQMHDLYHVTNVDIENDRIIIAIPSTSDVFNDVESLLSNIHTTYGKDALLVLDAIREAVHTLPPVWDIDYTGCMQLSLASMEAQNFELLDTMDILDALDIVEGRIEAANLEHMIDIGVMGFGGPMFDTTH